MRWQTTPTTRGLEILAGLDHHKVAIVSAWAGTGTVPIGQLPEQIALKEPKQNLPIIEDGKIGTKRILRLQLSNENLSESYTLNQLGIFISVDGQTPILYYIAQSDVGDEIPSGDEAGGFLAEYVATVIFSIGSDVVVECLEKPFVTQDALDAKISILMGIVPIDGGTFFEDYEPFEADGGDF